MILLDYNQAMLTSVIHSYNKVEVTEDFLLGSFLNRIREINKKHRGKYGQLVICCEGTKSWRKDFFPFYKAGRKQARDASYLDWPLILRMMNKLRDDLNNHFPYPVMQLETAEGDDIIATLSKKYSEKEHVLIFSGDKDFFQLHRYPNVDQYSPIEKKFLRSLKPNHDLKEKIIRGDSGDGVPNILSRDNIFLLEGVKQNRMKTEKVNRWIMEAPDEFCQNEEMKRNWIRNKTLIDFSEIPTALVEQIEAEFELQLNKPRRSKDHILSYLIDNGLVNFISDLQDF